MVGKKKQTFSGGSRKLTCLVCGYVTFLKARYTKHVKYHSMPFIKCEFCDFKTQYTWNLDRHMKNHNSLGAMGCPLCNFTCDMKQSLTSHVQNHHINVSEDILLHFRSASSTKSESIGETGSRRESFEMEEESESRSREILSPARLTKTFYKCRECNFNALSESGLIKHAESHRLDETERPLPLPPQLHKNPSGSGGNSPLIRMKQMPNLIPIPKESKNKKMPNSSPDILSKEEEEKIRFLRNLDLFPKVKEDENEWMESYSSIIESNNYPCDDNDNDAEVVEDYMDEDAVDYEDSRKEMTTPTSGGGGGVMTKSRKVYRCPQKDCEFWATTASRFHVHIVGHYNTKPFECSQCSYRSNWRWDITKHIKLKTMRDPSHSRAKVLLTHKSGERNYRKYDRYLVPMDVTYSADSKIPDCSTVASKRPDVELVPGPVICENETPAPFLPLPPRLTKAPGPSPLPTATPSYQTLREVLSRPTNNLHNFRSPSVSVSVSSLPKDERSTSTRSFVEKMLLSGGEMLHNTMESLGKDITVTPIRAEESKNTLQVPVNTKSLWKCKKCLFKHVKKEEVISHINFIHCTEYKETMSILNHNNLTRMSDASNSNSSFENYSDVFDANQMFSCSYCDATFSNQSRALAHLQLHFQTTEENQRTSEGVILPEEVHVKPRGAAQAGIVFKKYHCQECPYVTDSRSQFIYHKRFHMPSPCSPYQCSRCSYRVSHKHLLQQHIRVHQQQQVQENFKVVPLGSDADPDHDLEEIEGRPKFLVWKDGESFSVVRCRFCPQVFAKPKDLLEHELTGHNDDENDDNQEEDEASDEDKALNLSLKGSGRGTSNSPFPSTSHSQHYGNNDNLPLLYFCQECPARFLFEKELKIHQTFHEKMNSFLCPFCNYSARQEPHLFSHMTVHSTDYQKKTESLLSSGKYRSASASEEIQPPWKRNNMKAVTISKESRANRKILNDKGVNDSSSAKCRKCPARFSSLASFISHSSHHGRKTPWSCNVCDFGADSKTNLTLHSILHQGSEVTIEPTTSMTTDDIDLDEEDWNSELVGNPLFQYPTYVKNGRIKSKRYKCGKCPSAFEKRDQYKVHMGLHGSDQRYKCPVCDYAVTYYANFIQHLKKHESQPDVDKAVLVATPLSKVKRDLEIKKRVPPLVLKVPKSSTTTSSAFEEGGITCDKGFFDKRFKERFQVEESEPTSPETEGEDAEECDYETAVKNANSNYLVPG